VQGERRREEFEYAKPYFYSRAMLAILLLSVVVILFANQKGEALPWFALLVVLLGGSLLVFGISPLLTNHWLTRSRIVLRRGYYFKAVIPLREVSDVRIYEGEAKLGLALSLSSSILFVTSSRHDLVEIRLRGARRFPQMLGLRAKRIVFNVDRPTEFLASANERLASLAPVEA